MREDRAAGQGRTWARRWVLAGLAAVAVAMWPACAQKPADKASGANAANLDFVLKDMHGNDVRLADFKGRPIILNFWATWCGPCKVEIPAFVELVDKYKSQNLTVLGVSVDDAPQDLRQFAAEYKMNYPVLVGLGQDRLQETYEAVMIIPVTWFIRPDGTVLLKHTGPATKEWFETQVKAMLAAPATEAP